VIIGCRADDEAIAHGRLRVHAGEQVVIGRAACAHLHPFALGQAQVVTRFGLHPRQPARLVARQVQHGRVAELHLLGRKEPTAPRQRILQTQPKRAALRIASLWNAPPQRHVGIDLEEDCPIRMRQNLQIIQHLLAQRLA